MINKYKIATFMSADDNYVKSFEAVSDSIAKKFKPNESFRCSNFNTTREVFLECLKSTIQQMKPGEWVFLHAHGGVVNNSHYAVFSKKITFKTHELINFINNVYSNLNGTKGHNINIAFAACGIGQLTSVKATHSNVLLLGSNYEINTDYAANALNFIAQNCNNNSIYNISAQLCYKFVESFTLYSNNKAYKAKFDHISNETVDTYHKRHIAKLCTTFNFNFEIKKEEGSLLKIDDYLILYLSQNCKFDAIKEMFKYHKLMPNYVDRYNDSAILVATRYYGVKMLKFLDKNLKNLNWNIKFENHYNVFFTAAQFNRIDNILFLSSKNADINSIGLHNSTPLLRAIGHGNTEAAFKLIECGCDIYYKHPALKMNALEVSEEIMKNQQLVSKLKFITQKDQFEQKINYFRKNKSSSELSDPMIITIIKNAVNQKNLISSIAPKCMHFIIDQLLKVEELKEDRKKLLSSDDILFGIN